MELIFSVLLYDVFLHFCQPPLVRLPPNLHTFPPQARRSASSEGQNYLQAVFAHDNSIIRPFVAFSQKEGLP